MRFDTALPNLAPGPRFMDISNAVEAGALTQYHENPPLATKYPWPLHGDKHLGIMLDLVDSKKWQVPSHPQELKAEDAVLLDYQRLVTAK